uniref:Transposase n=1 Tax=Heterorhabditis bacteriophora TaxID=37862 RepID=A0A1I7WFN9_HETBA
MKNVISLDYLNNWNISPIIDIVSDYITFNI